MKPTDNSEKSIEVDPDLARLLDDIGTGGVIAQIVTWLMEDDREFPLESALRFIHMDAAEFELERKAQTRD